MKDSFKCNLELKGKGGKLSVKCGNISNILVNIFSYGFNGSVAFVVDKEAKIDFFYEAAVIEVKLTIESGYTDDTIKPFELNGIVTNKALFNQSIDGYAPDEVQKRECEIEFCDPAAAIWSQHFPVGIFTEKSMEDVIKSYISKLISIKFDSPAVKEKRPLIALGLGDPHNTVDFYTFLMWHFNETRDIWEYDYTEKQYIIRDKKDSSGQPIDLPYDPGLASIYWPLPSRQDMRIVNSYADDPTSKEVKRGEVYEGINRDYLNTTPIVAEVEEMAEDIKPKPNTHEHQLKIRFERYPEKNMFPGNLYTFNEPQWGKELFFKKKLYRLHTLQFAMNAIEDSYSKESPAEEQKYAGSLVGIFELKEEVHVQRPEIRVPFYPFPLEGKIFSEVGEEKELTFDIGKDEKTAQFYYTIELPWAKNQKVTAPFEPTYTNGQTYNPLLKGQRVVVHFHLFKAKIGEVLDWFGSAQLAHKKQGNRTVFAPRNEGKTYTIMEHVKEDDETLTFLIERKSDKQVQLIRIKEDGLHVIVHKEGEEDPQCHMWMDNKYTITITTQNKQENETQKITLKPQEVCTLCEKGGDKSTITQTPKSITIDCQEFNLKTKKTNFTSEEATVCKGKELNLEGSTGTKITDGAKIEISSAAIDIG